MVGFYGNAPSRLTSGKIGEEMTIYRNTLDLTFSRRTLSLLHRIVFKET